MKKILIASVLVLPVAALVAACCTGTAGKTGMATGAMGGPGGISGTTIPNNYGNCHTVTCGSTLAGNSALGGKTYTLTGGGTVIPK